MEWPRDEHGAAVARAPAGIADAYCRLGLVEVGDDGGLTVLSDCRELFPPLTALETLHYVSGDGQDAAPGAPLPQPLVLRVSRGSVPVVGAGIRFEVESGGGTVGDGAAASPILHETATDADGLAECHWTLGPGAAAPGRFQRVRASLLDADGDEIAGQVIVYCATASLLLLYVSGDGQEAAAGATLPYPLQLRVVNGGDGIAGLALDASVEEGGGALVSVSATTDAAGYASYGWQLGTGGPQRVAVRLRDAGGAELQRLEYAATVRAAATAGGGCDITIGRGGDFERLDGELLKRLLEENGGFVCLCFLPGIHDVEPLEIGGVGGARLSLHGCGPTALLRLRGAFELDGFRALELRDLAIELETERGVALRKNQAVRLAGLAIQRREPSEIEPCLLVEGATDLAMIGCVVGMGLPASAVIVGVTDNCRIDGNRFEGTLSFYGPPLENLAEKYLEALGNLPEMRFRGDGRLHFDGNDLQLLTMGGAVAEGLLNLVADGLFQTAVLGANVFRSQRNTFASTLLSFSENHFLAAPQDGVTPYGVMIAMRAAADGNVAVSVDDAAILHFLTQRPSGFKGAANQVFTRPPSP